MTPRPLLILTVAYASGIAASKLIALPWWVPLLASLFTAGTAAVFLFALKRNAFPLLAAFFVLMGYAAAVQGSGPPGRMERFLGKDVMLEGYISGADSREDKTVYTLEVKKVHEGSNIFSGEGSVLLYVPGAEAGLKYGDIIRAGGRPYLLKGFANPGSFDYGKYLNEMDIWALLSVKNESDIEKIGSGGGNPVAGMALGVKQRLVDINRSTLSPGYAALVNGMIFGGRGGIDPGIAEVFNESGVVHILSVSGLHVGFVVAAVLGIIGILRLQRVSFPTITAVLAIYTFITGMGPAVMRASLMAWIQLLGHHMGRDRDWPTTLMASALLILLFSPGSLFDPGFQLSFTATWGILHMGPVFDKGLERAGIKNRWIRGSISVSLGAIMGTLPLVAYYFNILSLISVPANLLAVPLVGLILPLGLVAGLAGMLFIKAAVVINYATAALLELLILLVRLVHSIPGGVVYVASPSLVAMAAWYFSLLMLPALWNRRSHKMLARVLLAGLLAVFPAISFFPAGSFSRGLLQVHVIDVGQGDSILVRFANGRNMLVDAGGQKGEYKKGRGAGEAVASYLRRIGVTRLDVLVLTHPHEDHAAGALYLLNRFDIGTVLIPPFNAAYEAAEPPDPAYGGLIAAMRLKGIPVRSVICGDKINIDPGARVVVIGPGINPVSGSRSDLNNNSVVISVRYGERSFLFTGDIEEEGQAQLMECGYNLQHDVLKVPHHGSRYVSPEFIEQVNPEFAVVSVGQNSFGQPSPDTLNLLESGKAAVFRTDRDGLTVLLCDGKTIKVRTQNCKAAGNF